MGLFARLCVYWPIKMDLLHELAARFDRLNFQTANPLEAEVPVTMMVALSQELTTGTKTISDENPYYQLVKHVFKNDLINQPCYLRHELPMKKLLEMLNRYSFFFPKE